MSSSRRKPGPNLPSLRRMGSGFRRDDGVVRVHYLTPPIAQMIFHSSAVTGCTDRREFLTSTMSWRARLSALMSSSVTGFGTSGARDVDAVPGVDLGGRIPVRKLHTSTMPTIALLFVRVIEEALDRRVSSPACCCAPDSCARRSIPRRLSPLAFCISQDQTLGLRFEQPIGHYSASGFLRAHFHALISTEPKRPALA